MSAQGATLRRGITHLPIWPIAALVVAAVAAVIGISLFDAVRPEGVASVTQSERLANSSAAVREQGAVAPAIPSIRPIDPAVLENSAAAVREQGATLGLGRTGIWGVSHVTPSTPTFAGFENPGAYIAPASTYPMGLENPAAYGAVTWDSIGGPNEALHRQYGATQEDLAPKTEPILVNGTPCMQCR